MIVLKVRFNFKELSKISTFRYNLKDLEVFASKLARNTILGNVYFLKGDLGSGKTTFSRFFINALFEKNKIEKPLNIKSPSFPILINYPIKNYEINHYDFYRLKHINELTELNFYENLHNNISIIEWPDIILENFHLNKYYLIEFEIIDYQLRLIKFLNHND